MAACEAASGEAESASGAEEELETLCGRGLLSVRIQFTSVKSTIGGGRVV